jgi:hypothetical protein
MSIRTTVAALAIAGPSLADGAATAISGVLAAGAAQPAPAVSPMGRAAEASRARKPPRHPSGAGKPQHQVT